MAKQQETYMRFNVFRRVQHWLLTASFALLAITGLPQRYPLAGWSNVVIRLLGGIELARIIHRISATVMAVMFFIHIFELIYLLLVKRVRPSMVPGLRDLKDLIGLALYNLGLAKEPPKMPRYNVMEKIEYWALIWGCIVMGLTGFMLWNPILTTRVLPGQFVPAAKTAHSYEALLAVLAILIWHVYWVHLRTLNLAMFTGKLSKEQMLHEHAGEWEEISKGVRGPALPAKVTRQRARLFWPVAVVVGVALVVGLYLFLTYEETALATVPPAEVAQALVSPTSTPTRAPTSTPLPPMTPAVQVRSEAPSKGAPMIAHPVEGWGDCAKCHARDGAFPVPADHVAFTSTTCSVCHPTAGEGKPPALIPHLVAGREDCLACHALSALPANHQKAAFTNADCLWCHAMSAQALTPTATPTPAPSPTPTPSPAPGTVPPVATAAAAPSFAAQIKPMLEAQCGVCHGGTRALGGLKVTDYESLAKGGNSGPAFVAGSPDQSVIVIKMKQSHPAVLSSTDLQMLIDWIAAGAKNN